MINLWTDTYRRCHPNTERFKDLQFQSWPRLEKSSVEISGSGFEPPNRDEQDLINSIEVPDGFDVVDEQVIGKQNKEEARDSIKKCGIEAIALYAPVHFHGKEHWGIYLHERRFFGLCSAMTDELGENNTNWDAVVSDLRRALMRHEYFHSAVELFCLVFEDIAGPFASENCAYNSYSKDIYQKSFPKIDCTEEQLATAAEFQIRYSTPRFGKVLAELTEQMPEAYSSWLRFKTINQFHAGIQELAGCIRENVENTHELVYPSIRLSRMRHQELGNIWFPETKPTSLDQFGPVPRFMYRSGGVTSNRTLKSLLGNVQMRKFLRALVREFKAVLESGGKEPQIRFPNGNKVPYPNKARNVPNYLPKEIADALGIAKKDVLHTMHLTCIR